jgi:hypothetical protein
MKRKLALAKETLRQLDTWSAAAVRGGLTVIGEPSLVTTASNKIGCTGSCITQAEGCGTANSAICNPDTRQV